MTKRILVAGASGVIGRRLLPQLIGAGYAVTGLTRSRESAARIEGLGAAAVIADVFDLPALTNGVKNAAPDAVVHQLTDLSLLADPSQAATALARNARIRTVGTCNLVEAYRAAAIGRIVAQSIAWVYADGPLPHGEDDPLDRDAPPPRSTTIAGVVALEEAVLRTPGIAGAVLRYGQLYGPGAANDKPTGPSPVHVDAAARAALLVLDLDSTGIFNIAERNASVATDKAREQLGWDPAFRLAG